MARRRRQKEPEPEPEEEEEQQIEEEQDDNAEEREDNDDADEMEVDGEEEQHQQLQFNQPLTWPAGKPIPVADLLRRLQKLCKELQSMKQEDIHKESLRKKAQELASKQLVNHKDNGVKAYTLWCIVEFFRLLAPDAPYKMSQLKDISNLFVSHVVPALAHPTDPYNGPHLKILESLSQIKSILVLTDAPGADQLVVNLFINCFDVLAGNVRGGSEEQLSKNVEFHMTGMLNVLIDEATTPPSGVIDILLAQFLRADPSVWAGGKRGDVHATSLPRELPPAYNMAKSICNSNEDKMIRYVGQYFNSVMIDASETMANPKSTKSKSRKRTRDMSDDESDDGATIQVSENDIEEVAKAHRLLRELWRSCPEVIRNVVPQVEMELNTENVQLRTMAVQTIGNMISGIGASGPPPSTPLDPAAYPPQSLEPHHPPANQSVMLTPAAPHAFASVYPTTWQAFVDRHRDKAPQVRSAWTTEAGQILYTSGGGKGLDVDQESELSQCLSDMLADTDEKVRLAAVHAISLFDYHSIVDKLCGSGGVASAGSLLNNLATRIRDPRQSVRTATIELLARIWGVAAGAIAEGSDRNRELFGPIPSKIFLAFYVNDPQLNSVVQRVLFESLLPVGYPPIKARPATNGDSQRVTDSQNEEDRGPDPDRIRTERMLVLVRDLEERAKAVFLSIRKRQPLYAKYLSSSLDSVETRGEKKIRDKLVKALAANFPEPSVAGHHLETLFEQHDRRLFSLLRFCISPGSDYRKVVNAIKEITKRLEQGPNNIVSTLETLTPFLRLVSLLVYNRSHVPAIMAISRTDDKGLGTAAHEIMKDISTQAPEVFKVHIKELCETLKKQAPSTSNSNDPTAVDSLKACAGFARAGHFPTDISKDRDFYQALVRFAIFGSPPRAAKHAVTVIVTSAEKKEMYIREILTACTQDPDPTEGSFISRLAALSQLRLLASDEVSDQNDAITEIVTNVLTHEDGGAKLDAKLWALKCLVNALRGHISAETDSISNTSKELSDYVFRLLNTLVEKEGELLRSGSTLDHHRAQMRLTAAKLILKLCCNKTLDKHFATRDFNRLIRIVQDSVTEVRADFNSALRKFLSQDKLQRRFYGLVFLYAFEPNKEIMERTSTFLKARSNAYARVSNPTMPGVFAFLISILAHHEDFSPNPEDLSDFVTYIMFYMKIVGTEKNMPEIYSIAQRVKTVRDGIDPEKSENLYILSDLSEVIIRTYTSLQGWSLQLLPGKARLPNGIYGSLPSHAEMQEITEKRYLPEEIADSLEDTIKDLMKTKKRKSGDDQTKKSTKKAKTSASATSAVNSKSKLEKVKRPARTPAKKTAKKLKRKPGDDDDGENDGVVVPSSERRKSGRTSTAARNYTENDDSEDDEELEKWNEQEEAADDDDDEEDEEGETSTVEDDDDKHEDDEANKENFDSPTPPTSDLPAAAHKNSAEKKRASPASAAAATGGRPKRGGARGANAAASDPAPAPAPQKRTAIAVTKGRKAAKSAAIGKKAVPSLPPPPKKKKKDVCDIDNRGSEDLSDVPSEVDEA